MQTDGVNEDKKELPPISGDIRRDTEYCCKIGQMADDYNLRGLDQEITRRYDAEGKTLHEIRDYVNNQITAATITQTEWNSPHDPSTVRAAIVEDSSISPTVRDNIRAALSAEIDIEVLKKSFVSHETVRTHLNNHLDVSTSKGGFDTYDEFTEVMEKYQEQYMNAVESALRRAADKGIISGEEFEVFHTRVVCNKCEKTYLLSDLLNQKGCDC